MKRLAPDVDGQRHCQSPFAPSRTIQVGVAFLRLGIRGAPWVVVPPDEELSPADPLLTRIAH